MNMEHVTCFHMFILRRLRKMVTKLLSMEDIGLIFRYAGGVRRMFLASYRNPEALRVLKSTEAISLERRKQLMENTYTIHPFSDFRWIWKLFICVLIFLLTICESLLLTFDLSENTIYLKGVVYFMNIVFFMDIFLHFFTGYYDKEKRTIRMDLNNIAFHYIKSKLFIHVLFSVPWYLIAEINGLSQKHNFVLLSATRIMRLPEISHFLFALEMNTLRRKLLYQLVNVLVYTFILFHFATCAQLIGDSENSWRVLEKFDELEGLPQQYSTALYRASASLLLYGGSNTNKSIEDRTLTSILRLIGVLYYLFCISYIVVIVQSMNWANKNRQFMTKNVQEMIRFKRLSKTTKRRIEYYVKHRLDYMIDKNGVEKILSRNLAKELREVRFRNVIEKIDVFESLPHIVKALLASKMKEDVSLPGDVINEVGDCLYFVNTGKLAVFDSNDNEILHLEEGSYFGEIAIISDEVFEKAKFVAIDTCQMFVLHKKDFRMVMSSYPEVFRSLKTIIEGSLQERSETFT